MIVFTLIYSLFVLYAILILFITVGWLRLKETPTHIASKTVIVSLIIAIRNEETHIERLLNSILSQDYPSDSLEIVLVDDHSTDSTYGNILKLIEQHGAGKNIQLISLDENLHGKKAAIKKGIEFSTGELIVTTDADCTASPEWISALAGYYSLYKPQMILGPVRIEYDGNFFSKLQAFEFSSLIATGAGSCKAGFALMANGANMAYTRKAYEACGGFKDSLQFASGDDMFMMLNIKKHFGTKAIHFLRSRDAIVVTSPVLSIKTFIQQRKRWVSKSRGYTDGWLIFSSLLVFLVNFSLVFTGSLTLFNTNFGVHFFQLLLIKLLIDFPLLFSFNRFQKSLILMWYFPLAELVNAIYTSYIGIVGNIGKYTWKERKSN